MIVYKIQEKIIKYLEVVREPVIVVVLSNGRLSYLNNSFNWLNGKIAKSGRYVNTMYKNK